MTGNAIFIQTDLLRSVASGDEQAFEDLHRRYKEQVYTIAMDHTAFPVYAQEITQDVFVLAGIQKEQLPAIRDFSAWLATITRNRSLGVLRSIARHGNRRGDILVDVPGESAYRDDPTLRVEVERCVREAIDLLSPLLRRVFELYRIRECSDEVTGRELGISPENARLHYVYALRSIRASLIGKDVFLPSVLSLYPIFL